MQHKTGGAFLVTVHITEEEPNFFFATSPDMPELMLGHDSVQTIMEQLPVVIQRIAEVNTGGTVFVAQLEKTRDETFLTRPWVVIPAAVINAIKQPAMA